MLRRNNFRGSSALTGELSSEQRESLGPLIAAGISREKLGVLKEHHRLDLYRDEEGKDFDESGFLKV